MTAILTPALALHHLRELSTDVRAALALAPTGERLAGDAAIEAPARALLELAGAAGAPTVATARGAVLVARTPAAAFVVAAGPHVLLELLRHDLDTLVRDTWDAPSRPLRDVPETGATAVDGPLAAAAEAVIGAAASDFAR
jgi:hypothetical protein